MTSPTQYLHEANTISDTFRKEIRRRDINARFAKRRQQLLEEQRNELLNPNNHNYQSYISSQLYASLNQNMKNFSEVEMKWKQFQETVRNIEHQFLEKGIIMTDWIYFLAQGSVEMQGAQIVCKLCHTFFIEMYDKFISPQQCDSTKQQQLALLIIVNILTLVQPTSSTTLICPTLAQILHILSMEEPIDRIFSLVLEQTIPAYTKQYALDLIFNIISTSDVSFLQNLINCQEYAIISKIYNIVNAKPSQIVVIQALRCYYVLLKRLGWQELEKVGKIRKLLNLTIIKTNINTQSSYHLLLFSTMSLQAMLRSLPNQRQNPDNGHILPIIFEKTHALNRQDLTIHTLSLVSLLMNKNDEIQQKIFLFLEQNLIRTTSVPIQTKIFKILYDTFLNTTHNPAQILSKFPQIFPKMQEMFYSNFTQISVNVEVSFCMALLATKIKGVEQQQINKIRRRIQQMMNNEISEQNLKQLQKSEGMINNVI